MKTFIIKVNDDIGFEEQVAKIAKKLKEKHPNMTAKEIFDKICDDNDIYAPVWSIEEIATVEDIINQNIKDSCTKDEDEVKVDINLKEYTYNGIHAIRKWLREKGIFFNYNMYKPNHIIAYLKPEQRKEFIEKSGIGKTFELLKADEVEYDPDDDPHDYSVHEEY